MEAHVCLNCGAPLNKEGQIYQCPYCRATYEDDAEERASVTLKSLLDERKVEQYSRAKRVLYTAVHAQYPSSEEVLSAARAVLAIEDQDVLANVYVFSHDEDPYRLNPYLTSLHVTKPEADEILRWLVPSLHVRTGPAIKAFIEHHYADAEFTRRITEVEDAIEKLDEGVYEATLMRDVFVAYSSADLEKAIHVVNLIEENGLSCFLASRNLRHGKGAAENYLIRLKEAMNSCAVFLFLSSPNSLSATCDAIRVELPYLVQNCPDKPRIQYIIKDTPHVPFIVSRTLKAAFPEQEWCRDEEDLLTRIFDHLEAKPSKVELERQRLEEERRQLEAEKARIAAEAEAERKRLEEERQRIQAEVETPNGSAERKPRATQPQRAVAPKPKKPSGSSSSKKSPMDRLPEGFRPIVKQMADQARNSPFAQTMMMVKNSLSMLAQSIMAGSRGRISIDAAIGIAVTIMGRALIVGGKEPSLLTVTGIADAIGTSQNQIQDVVNANRDGRKYQEIWSQLGEVDASTGRALLSFATQCVVLDGEPNKAQVDFLLDILQRIGFN